MNSMLYIYMKGATGPERELAALEHCTMFMEFFKLNAQTGSLHDYIQTSQYKITQRDIIHIIFEVGDIKVALRYDTDSMRLRTNQQFIQDL